MPSPAALLPMSSLHLILGGARSGKSRHAESLALQAQGAGAQVVYLATAWAGDDEMRDRIAHHRAARPPHWHTIEVPVAPRALAQALQAHAGVGRFVLVDCLTLWLTQLCFPPPGHAEHDATAAVEALLAVLNGLPGEVVLVSNEIGWGVTPLGAQTRRFVDELGRVHQRVAALADTVTLVVAGQALRVKPSCN